MTIPNAPELVEAILLACLEPDPIRFRPADEDAVRRVKAAIKKGVSSTGASFRDPVNRNGFLLGCLDFTATLHEEHLIVGYGWRYGNTTSIERLHHVVGLERSVAIPTYVRDEMRRHHFHATDAEVIIFHNHPRKGDEAEWLYFLKALLQDLPIASNADRKELVEQHALNLVGVLRELFGQGRVLCYLGESRYVRQFRLPRVLSFLQQLNALKNPQSVPPS